MTDAVSESIIREALADLTLNEDDGTMEGLVVPWDQETDVADLRSSGVIRYREVFRRGSCDRAIRAADRLTLTYGHSNSFADRLGHAMILEDRVAGLWGKFRLDRSKVDAARDALGSTHKGLSVSFRSVIPRIGTERAGETVERRSVVLEHIAAVPNPAYAEARILSLREGEDDTDLTDNEKKALADEAQERSAAERARTESAELMALADQLVEANEALRHRLGLSPDVSDAR